MILEKLEKLPNLFSTKGATSEQIARAEAELGVKFASEYVLILERFGAVSFCATEWSGLNVDEYLDVVFLTKEAREFNENFPLDLVVLEDGGADVGVVALNEKGEVFSVFGGRVEKLYDGLEEYLDECVSRAE